MSSYASESVSNLTSNVDIDEVQNALDLYNAFEVQSGPAARRAWLSTIDSKLRTSLKAEISRRKKYAKVRGKEMALSHIDEVVEVDQRSPSYLPDDIGTALPIVNDPEIDSFLEEDYTSTIETQNVKSGSGVAPDSKTSRLHTLTRNISTTLPYRMGFTTPYLHRSYLAIRREARRQCSNISFDKYWSDQNTTSKKLDIEELMQLWNRDGSYGWERSLIVELLESLCRTGAQNAARRQRRAERGTGIDDAVVMKLKPGRKRKSIKQAIFANEHGNAHSYEVEQITMPLSLKRQILTLNKQIASAFQSKISHCSTAATSVSEYRAKSMSSRVDSPFQCEARGSGRRTSSVNDSSKSFAGIVDSTSHAQDSGFQHRIFDQNYHDVTSAFLPSLFKLSRRDN